MVEQPEEKWELLIMKKLPCKISRQIKRTEDEKY